MPVAQFKKKMTELQLAFDRRSLNRLMTAFDTNYSGSVTIDAFLAALNTHESRGSQENPLEQDQ